MYSPLKVTTRQDGIIEEQRQTEIIADYLDHLSVPLVGILPYARRQEIRLEIEGNLYALIGEQREGGLNLLEATETALHRHGIPYRLGQEIADSWCAGPGSRTTPKRYGRIAMLRAFGCFSTPTAISCLLIEKSALSGTGTERPAWFLMWLFVSPLLAGALSGWIIPTRSARAVFHTQVLLLLYSLVVGLGLLPWRDGLSWTLFQLFYGLPIGALTASLFEALHRHYHRASFRRVAVG